MHTPVESPSTRAHTSIPTVEASAYCTQSHSSTTCAQRGGARLHGRRSRVPGGSDAKGQKSSGGRRSQARPRCVTRAERCGSHIPHANQPPHTIVALPLWPRLPTAAALCGRPLMASGAHARSSHQPSAISHHHIINHRPHLDRPRLPLRIAIRPALPPPSTRTRTVRAAPLHKPSRRAQRLEPRWAGCWRGRPRRRRLYKLL